MFKNFGELRPPSLRATASQAGFEASGFIFFDEADFGELIKFLINTGEFFRGFRFFVFGNEFLVVLDHAFRIVRAFKIPMAAGDCLAQGFFG